MPRQRSDRCSTLWPLIGASGMATLVWMSVAGLTLQWRSTLLPAAACAGLEAVAAFYRSARPDPRLSAALSGVAQLVAFSAVAACLSYAAAATGGPLQDGALFAADRALGLDWRAFLGAVDARPWLGRLLTAAYESLKPQLILVVALLAFTGRATALRRFLMALLVATLVTILVSGLVPALGVFDLLKLRASDYPNFHPAAPDLHLMAMHGLRDGTLRTLSLGQLEGIITFPSLHAALGLLLAAAFWPVRWARWPGLVLNGLLVASTPLNGSHYFVDVTSGLGIAMLALAVSRLWIGNEAVPDACAASAGGAPHVAAAPLRTVVP